MCALSTATFTMALKHNHTIRSLNLSRNGIGVVGVGPLADALHQNNTLTSLDLAGNCVGAEGVGLLSEALRNKPPPGSVKEVPEEGEVIQWLRTIGLPVEKVAEYGVAFKVQSINSTLYPTNGVRRGFQGTVY